MTDLYQRESRCIAKLAQLRFFPQAVVGGKGACLTADDGRQLLDFSASWGAASLGYAHPAIREAVHQALTDQAGASYLSSANAPCLLLAEKLLALVPPRARGRVWFGHSGSDANETVARVVVAATGRMHILAFEGAYHGGTVGSMGISGHPAQSGSRADNLHLMPWPTGDGSNTLDHLKTLFRSIKPKQVAACFIEPIQSDGGMHLPPAGFFLQLQAICRQHGILLVCDEVKVGLGRTGLWHAFEHFDLEPDILVFGKGLGGGLPISAVVGPAHIMNHASHFAMQTLHGNPVCAAAALAVLQYIEGQQLIENARTVGTFLQQQLNQLAKTEPLIGQVRGRGLAIGIELNDEDGKQAALAVYHAFELGLVLYYVGENSNVLELTPPLNLTEGEAAQGINLLKQALADVRAKRVDESLLKDFAGW
ncbi:aminotransferase [Ventosimonas gracilis]|uniref:Aminotransferase n=1 Tax=Ventosimonas gracilis TaxID=1680762 RepID=A0A139SW09_9GAMM|nr:aspartate aminotransferase family protein [Ventosimonas gracilis]KXU38777.1 aminotransferase [Ventosimonas gracilis]